MRSMTDVLDPDALARGERQAREPLPPFGDVTRPASAFRAFLHGLPGADEIGVVIGRGACLTGRYLDVFEEICEVRDACGPAHLKVILETGELVTCDNVRRASWLAMLAGADFSKTSTGKISPAATLPVCLVMLQAVRDFRAATGRQVGVKPAGGIRTTKDAVRHLVLVNETV